MGFIVLLSIGALLLATVSGFFSVWGLAQTYSGIFWCVVAMGVAIEYGKLIAISYIYRFWNEGPKLLNYYLLVAIAAVMMVTGAGHYGFLSSGYQTDSLPLKQVQEQITVLEEERTRVLDRKTQIDTQISQLPTNSVRGRTQLIRQFRGEQQQTTARVTELDSKLLELKQQRITSEAHTGPIVFIAKAANVDTDTATHYLTLLLIFVFDPLAIALTWATNVAIRKRADSLLPVEEPELIDVDEPEIIDKPTEVADQIYEAAYEEPQVLTSELIPEVEIEDTVEPEPVPEPQIVDAEDKVELDQPTQSSATPPARRRRPYPGTWSTNPNQSVTELMSHYKYLAAKLAASDPNDAFTNDDEWEMKAIEEVLTKQGLGQYIK
jgi:hypothetical protein